MSSPRPIPCAELRGHLDKPLAFSFLGSLVHVRKRIWGQSGVSTGQGEGRKEQWWGRATKRGADEAPHCSRSLRNESSTAGSGSRAQGSLSMWSPSRPSGSMCRPSSPSPSPAADTSKPGTPARAAAISLEKPGEASPGWAEEMGEDPCPVNSSRTPDLLRRQQRHHPLLP